MNQVNMILESIRSSIETLNKILVNNPEGLTEDKVAEIKGKIKELEDYRNSLLEYFNFDSI